MRRRMRWGILLFLALVTVGGLALDGSTAQAGVKPSDREGTWEFTIPIRFFDGDTLDFDHGTTVDLHSDLGWGFGFGYNFNEHMNLGGEFSWMSSNYTVNWAAAPPSPPATASATGNLDASSTTVNFTFNFMPKTVTPYVSAGIGWSWVDTNIPSGIPQTGCWWDPWYGYVCSTFQDTKDFSGFSYGFGAGVRIEIQQAFFMRLGINDNWQDFGSYASSPDFLSYRFDLGWKF